MVRADEERARRLAQALRDNLRRRKTQARGGEERKEVRDKGAPAADRAEEES